MADEASEQELKKTLSILQSMIDVSAQLLEGLRTQCATSAELTQHEIRILEGKLIKLFSKQLITKTKLGTRCQDHIPSLSIWLQVVGLSTSSIQGVCGRITSMEELQEKSEHELRAILHERGGAKPEELSRLCRALHNLKRYMDVLKRGDNDNVDMMLYWDSWDHHHPLQKACGGLSPRTGRSRAARASVPSEESLRLNNNNRAGGAIIIPPSSSVSSINSLNAQCVFGPPLTPPPQSQRGKGMRFSNTPPPSRKHNTAIQTVVLLPDYPLTKSKSHESQLANKGENNGGEVGGGTGENGPVMGPTGSGGGRRIRLPTEPGPEIDSNMVSPMNSPPSHNYPGTDSDDNSCKSGASHSQLPKSPRSTQPVLHSMTHQIYHRFQKTFRMTSTCHYCQKVIFGPGLKCRDCKYLCHRECEDKAVPSCGLPKEFLDEFKKKLSSDGQVFPSPMTERAGSKAKRKGISSLTKRRKSSHAVQTAINIQSFPPHDSSSNTSSCNSSTPSSPAVQSLPTPHSSQKSQFSFPDIPHNDVNEIGADTLSLSHPHHHHHHTSSSSSSHSHSTMHQQYEVTGSQQSRDTDRTASGSTSTDSDKTPVRVDSQDSQVSDTETITDHRWPRQNSMSMREWDIPFEELRMGDIIGTGRFGTVFRGYWHGDVAVKVLNMNYLKDEQTMEQFRQEVSTFRKTRHENLILFMGACMQPPTLAIVTSLSKGMTLYTHIHLRKDKFNMNKTTIVAQQISQGMGYLHAKGIVHKDLKSKNIFLENGKVVITDFGLFSVTKLCFGNRKSDSLWIPPGWLCYLAPEIMKKLHAHQEYAEDLPFSKYSDIYAFGTVWYELLCGEWPFKLQPPEAIIWQVGNGLKQPLANLQASRDVKDILMLCWSYHKEKRPDFISLVNILDKIPKKRLARSPSHPIHLSRSAESVF